MPPPARLSSRLKMRLRNFSLQDLFTIALPAILLLAGGFWLAAQFIRPAPPHQLILTTGGEGGAYQRFAARYKDVLERQGIALIEKPSAGSAENLARLRDPNDAVDAGFIQGGTARAASDDTLLSLGSLYYEPLWVFYRAGLARNPPQGKLEKPGELDQISQLKGRRIAIGGTGSGSNQLALELLETNGISQPPTKLIERGGLGLIEELQQGKLDAVMVVGPTQSALVWALLYAPGIKLMSLTHADAYARQLPHLTRLTLPRGAVDMVRDLPPHDVNLVAPMATLVVREDTHPALVGLLMQAAIEVHGDAGVFQKPGEFPRPMQVDFPISKEAEHYFKSGKPFLQRYLPFWAATLIDRLIVMLVPVLALLLPIVKLAPSAYSWRVRQRIFRRYGELKFIEAELDQDPGSHPRAEWLARIDAIEQDANRMPTPLAYSDMLYTLRSHIDLVREAILRRT